MSRQHEVTTPQPLLNEKGLIMEPGWARTPVWQYDRSDIRASVFRRKEWDYYLVTAKDFAVAFTICDAGYMGLGSVSFLDLKEATDVTRTEVDLLPLGRKYGLTQRSSNGFGEFQKGGLHLRYRTRHHRRRIQCIYKDFYQGTDFRCDIVLTQPDDDTMVIATPWAEKPTAFYYNQKINCMPAVGHVSFKGQDYYFQPTTDFGLLDWGRGVWTYDNIWYWGTASGLLNGKRFGYNLGYGFSDRSSASENMIFYDGTAHKLGRVDILIPQMETDHSYRYMEPWTITSEGQRFQGTFTPILDRYASLDYKLILSLQHQVFGYFDGTAILDDGTVLEISHFLTSVEHVHNKY